MGHHPAWGWQHSERDERLALQFASEDVLPIDRDAPFAAATMHDMAACEPWAKAPPKPVASARREAPPTPRLDPASATSAAKRAR